MFSIHIIGKENILRQQERKGKWIKKKGKVEEKAGKMEKKGEQFVAEVDLKC